MRGRLEGIQPGWRRGNVLRQFGNAVDGLVGCVDGLVCAGLNFGSVGDVFQVRIVLIGAGGAEEHDAEEDEAGEGCDYLQPSGEEGAGVPACGHGVMIILLLSMARWPAIGSRYSCNYRFRVEMRLRVVASSA